MRVGLFPGHFAKDSGAIDEIRGQDDKLYSVEAAVTWGIYSHVHMLLTASGIDHDKGVGSFEQRLEQTKGCTLGVSIHADISSREDTNGYHCIYYPRSRNGKRLATALDQNLYHVAHRHRQIHSRSNLAILRRTTFPTVVVECGFLSNPVEEAQLLNEIHQFNLAFAIVAGLKEFVYNSH